MNLWLMNEKTVAQSADSPSLYTVILRNSALNEWMDGWRDEDWSQPQTTQVVMAKAKIQTGISQTSEHNLGCCPIQQALVSESQTQWDEPFP